MSWFERHGSIPRLRVGLTDVEKLVRVEEHEAEVGQGPSFGADLPRHDIRTVAVHARQLLVPGYQLADQLLDERTAHRLRQLRPYGGRTPMMLEHTREVFVTDGAFTLGGLAVVDARERVTQPFVEVGRGAFQVDGQGEGTLVGEGAVPQGEDLRRHCRLVPAVPWRLRAVAVEDVEDLVRKRPRGMGVKGAAMALARLERRDVGRGDAPHDVPRLQCPLPVDLGERARAARLAIEL